MQATFWFSGRINVRFGSKADIGTAVRDVRFVPKADIGRPPGSDSHQEQVATLERHPTVSLALFQTTEAESALATLTTAKRGT